MNRRGLIIVLAAAVLAVAAGVVYLRRPPLPAPGSPAYDAGIVAGDLVTKVEDESTAGMTGEQAHSKITGEPGSKVTLTIRREGHNPPEFPVALTRARVARHTVMGVSRRADEPYVENVFRLDGNRPL